MIGLGQGELSADRDEDAHVEGAAHDRPAAGDGAAATQLAVRVANLSLGPWAQLLPLAVPVSGRAEANLQMNEPLATVEMSGFSSYPLSGLPLKFFEPPPATAYEPIPSSAITPATATTLNTTLDIRTSPGCVGRANSRQNDLRGTGEVGFRPRRARRDEA